MEEYKFIYVLTKNDKVNKIKSFQDALDFYSESVKYLVLVENKQYRKYPVNNFVDSYQYIVQKKILKKKTPLLHLGILNYESYIIKQM